MLGSQLTILKEIFLKKDNLTDRDCKLSFPKLEFFLFFMMIVFKDVFSFIRINKNKERIYFFCVRDMGEIKVFSLIE